MSDVYTAPTPGGSKPSVNFGELGLAYNVDAANIRLSDQKTPEYLEIERPCGSRR